MNTEPRRSWAFTPASVCLIAWLFLGTLWLLAMQQFPWCIDSDDAMNFAHGLERFSVLEFRPHFPGYPGMILGATLIEWLVQSDESGWAVIAFSLLGALSIPLFLSLICLHLTARLWLGLTVLVLAMTSPMLAGLGLSGLSDAPALALVVAGVLALLHRRYRFAGLLLGSALAVRPSYLLLVLPVLAAVWQEPSGRARREALVSLIWPILLTGVVSLIFLLAQDGLAWFVEGQRFVLGHFQIWGHSVSSDAEAPSHWLDQLRERIGLVSSLLLVLSALLGIGLRPSHPASLAIRWLSVVAASYLLVMLLTQNPHNLRHFAPVFFLGLLLAVVWADQGQRWLAQRFSAQPGRREMPLPWAVMLLTGVMMAGYLPTWQAAPTDSPIQAAVRYLEAQTWDGADQALGVNHQVNFLRERLPQLAIYDLYYPSQLFMLRNRTHGLSWRLSTTRLHEPFYRLEQQFGYRFPTERSLYLYRIVGSGR